MKSEKGAFLTKSANGLNIYDIENYVKTLFELQKQLVDKDFKIAMLEFELAIEKQLCNAFKKDE